jgi:hypothetical protein
MSVRQLAGWIGLVSGVMAISAVALARWQWAAGLGVIVVTCILVAWRWESRE